MVEGRRKFPPAPALSMFSEGDGRSRTRKGGKPTGHDGMASAGSGTASLGVHYLRHDDGPDLFVRVVRPPSAHTRLLFVHASLVHSEYYLPLAFGLAMHGVETWLPDLRGHGRSGGTRGHTRDWFDPVRDVTAVWAAMQERGRATRTFLGGESYGALTSYLAIRSRNVDPDGAVFLSPAFGLHFRPSPLLWWLLTRCAWPVAGWVRPLRRLPVEGVTRSATVRRIIESDPLCNRRYTLGFLLHLMATQRRVPHPDPDWQLPSLLVTSSGDPITDNTASRDVLGSSSAVTWHECAGSLHSLVADDPDTVVGIVIAWLTARSEHLGYVQSP